MIGLDVVKCVNSNIQFESNYMQGTHCVTVFPEVQRHVTNARPSGRVQTNHVNRVVLRNKGEN